MKVTSLTAAALLSAAAVEASVGPVIWEDGTFTNAAPGFLEKNTGSYGWNAGAMSQQKLLYSAVAQSVSFTCSAGKNILLGLGNANTGAGREDVAFGIC